MADSSAWVTVKGPALPALKISPLWKLGHQWTSQVRHLETKQNKPNQNKKEATKKQKLLVQILVVYAGSSVQSWSAVMVQKAKKTPGYTQKENNTENVVMELQNCKIHLYPE